MQSMLRTKLWSAAICVLYLIPSTQSQTAPAPGPVVLKSTTRLVQINVIAQDKKGQPIPDLTKQEFHIKVNGKPQPVSVFSVESTGALPQSAPVKLPPNTFTNRLEEREGTPSSVTLLLLDALNTKFEDQAYAKQQVIQFLRQIQPSDRIAIYALGRNLRVLHDYTTDASDLVRRLSKYGPQNIPDLAASEPSGALGDDSFNLDSWMRGGGVSGAEADFYTVNRVQGTLRAIEFIADHVARIPGRKNLIWVSGGFPLTIGFDDLSARADPSREQRTFTPEMDRTVRAVNNANLAIYPVDARGLIVDPRFSAENRMADLRPNTRPSLRPPPGVRNQESMRELASRTGGRAYYNTNDLKNAIREAVEDARLTYTLGFYPSDEKFDGKFHEIKLQVDRPGVNLRYRKGYFDFGERPQDDRTRKAELQDAVWSPIDASAIGLVVKARRTGPPDAFEVYVTVESSGISLEQQGNRWAGRLDIIMVQKDDGGSQYNAATDVIELRLLQPNYQRVLREGLTYRKLVARASQAKSLRVVVRDAASGSIGSVTIPLNQIIG
ncbi:MAG: VWA domain-containing protein [Bryobacteraceae bacterium]